MKTPLPLGSLLYSYYRNDYARILFVVLILIQFLCSFFTGHSYRWLEITGILLMSLVYTIIETITFYK